MTPSSTRPTLINAITSGSLLKPHIESLVTDDNDLAEWLYSDNRPPVLVENQHGQLLTVSAVGEIVVLTAGPIAGISNALLAASYAAGTFRETAKAALDASGLESISMMLKERMHAGEIPSDHILLGTMQHRLLVLEHQYHRLDGANTLTTSGRSMIDEQGHFLLGDLTVNIDPDCSVFTQKRFMLTKPTPQAVREASVVQAFPTPQALSLWFNLEYVQARGGDVEAMVANVLPIVRDCTKLNGLSREYLSVCQFGAERAPCPQPRAYLSLARQDREFSDLPDRKPPMPRSGVLRSNGRDFFVVQLALPGLGESLSAIDELQRALINPLLDWVSDDSVLPALNLLKCEITDGLKEALADYAKAQEVKQCVSVHFSTRSPAFAEELTQPLGARFREVIAVLVGIADALPEAVETLRATSTSTEEASWPVRDSNGAAIGQVFLCQDPEDLPEVKKGDVSLSFPMSHVDAPDCAMGRGSLRLAAQLLRQRGLTDELVQSVPGVLELQMRPPKGERLNDQIAQRLAELPADGLIDPQASAALIRLAREVNGNPDGTYLGVTRFIDPIMARVESAITQEMAP